MSGVASNALVSAIGMAVQGAARFAYTWAIAAYMSHEVVGDTNALLNLAVYAALFWPQGAGVAATRYLPVAGEAIPALTFLTRSTLAAIGVLAAAGFGAGWVLVGDPVSAAAAAALIATYSGYVFTRSVLLGRDRVVDAAIGDAISSAVSLAALVAVLLGQVSWALLVPLAAGYLVFSVMHWPRGQTERPSPAFRREVTRFTLVNSLGVLASGGLLPATMMTVQAFDRPAAAHFAVAISLATPASMLSQALNQVVVPRLAGMRGDDAAVIRTWHAKVFALSSAAFLVIFGLLIWLAPAILSFFWGDKYAESTLALRLLLGIVLLMSVMAAPSAYLVTMGHQRAYALIWMVGFVVGTIVLVTAGPAWGQWGALAGYGLGAGGGALVVICLALLLPPKGPAAMTPTGDS